MSVFESGRYQLLPRDIVLTLLGTPAWISGQRSSATWLEARDMSPKFAAVWYRQCAHHRQNPGDR